MFEVQPGPVTVDWSQATVDEHGQPFDASQVVHLLEHLYDIPADEARVRFCAGDFGREHMVAQAGFIDFHETSILLHGPAQSDLDAVFAPQADPNGSTLLYLTDDEQTLITVLLISRPGGASSVALTAD